MRKTHEARPECGLGLTNSLRELWYGGGRKFQMVMITNTNYNMVEFDPKLREEENERLKDEFQDSLVGVMNFLSDRGEIEHMRTLTKLNKIFVSLVEENQYLAEKLDEAAASMIAFQAQVVMNNPLSTKRIKN